METKKIGVQDLINIGLFTALYFVIVFIVGMTGAVPVMMIALPVLIAFFGAVPVLLLVAKTQKFGVLSLCGIIVNVIMAIMGHPWPSMVIAIPLIIIGDLIMNVGKYKQWFWIITGYVVFSIWTTGGLLPFYIMRDKYFSNMKQNHGEDYAKAFDSVFTYQVLPVIFILCILGAIAGGFIAKQILKKHFQRSGVL
ncbi:MptD family putative ECF transporter S component [Mammaliicoccus lentus]|uniref:MptD family putative ECF transporter S component n=1 Tax=Mammaliicoccus lentus TaxID=42858 RepID=UPI000E0761BD|nr:MptD family putative ECF transporter S component [Mammaliicoccus lentus]WQK50222.1 MptD family putative ECF transporter S component [Mammaliicoccus lentus]SUM50699.1 substrate-specific component of ECF transporter [Mammaliicoccus lentus]